MSLATSSLTENLCRTCMEVEEFQCFILPERETSKGLFSIFSEPQQPVAGSNMTIMELLKQTTPQLTIDINDMLPKNVCKNCLDKLVNIHEFQQNCLVVERRLLKLVNENNTTTNAVTKEDDPLTSSIKQEAITDLCNIVKIEMQEHLIDTNTNSNDDTVSNTTYGFDNGQTSRVWMENSGDVGAEYGNLYNNTQDDLKLSKTCTSNGANQRREEDVNSSGDNEGSSLQGLGEPFIKEEKADADEYGSLLKNRKSLRIEKIHLPPKVGTNKARKVKYIDQSGNADHSDEDDSNSHEIYEDYLRPKDDTKKRMKAKYKNQCNTADGSDDEDYNTNEIDEDEQSEADDRLSLIDIKVEVADATIVSPISNADQHNITKADLKHDQNCEEKTFACDECGSHLKTAQSLKRHKLIHLRQPGVKDNQNCEDKPFVCFECGTRLTTQRSLNRHKLIHLRKPGEKSRMKHECEYCQKKFTHTQYLKNHLRKHTGEKFLCSVCGKSFHRLLNLKQHVLRHGTDRPYECPHCPKKFRCKSDLGSHKATHSKSKPHVCDICGAAFVLPYMLKTHKLYHTGEKKFKCDYCDKRFVLADPCRRHMRTHTGEKPYKCKYCVRAFAQSNDLIKHLRVHIGDDVYRCEMCPQGFRLLADLRAHFPTHKNDDDETKRRNLEALKKEELRIKLSVGQVAEEQ